MVQVSFFIVSHSPKIITNLVGLFPPFFVSESNKSHISGLTINNGTKIEVKDNESPIRISFTHTEQEVIQTNSVAF